MGYYTHFEIEVTGENDLEEVVTTLNNISDYCFESQGGVISSDEIKWYKNDDHMKALSKRYPHNLFQVDGNGEEEDDYWRRFYRNGKREDIPTEFKVTHGESQFKKDFEADEAIEKMLTGDK